MMARLHACAGLGIALALAPALAEMLRGEGLLAKPPVVGTSVTYHLEQTVYSDEDEQQREREVTISCVGKEATDGGTAYWIEILRPSRSGESRQLYKLLIKEESFVRGQSPLQDFVRGYFQADVDDDDFEELDKEGRRARRMGRFLLPVPSFAEVTGEASEDVELENMGTFRCAVRKGESEQEIFDGNATLYHAATMYLSDDIPFGIARAEVSTDMDFGGGGRSIDATVVVTNITREGAASLLPEAK